MIREVTIRVEPDDGAAPYTLTYYVHEGRVYPSRGYETAPDEPARRLARLVLEGIDRGTLAK